MCNSPDWLLCNAAHRGLLETSQCTATSAGAALAPVTSRNPLNMVQRPPMNAAMMQPSTEKNCKDQSLPLLRFRSTFQRVHGAFSLLCRPYNLGCSVDLRPYSLLNCLRHLCLAQHVDTGAHWILHAVQAVALQGALNPPPGSLPALASQLFGHAFPGKDLKHELAYTACYQSVRMGCQEMTVTTVKDCFDGM